MIKRPLIVLEFLDHAVATGYENATPISCIAVGFLIKEDKKAYYLCSWIGDHPESDDSEYYVILKSTVTKKHKYGNSRT